MIPLGKLLGNISKRGTLYAISVYPVNQAKESFTVNILQGDSEGMLILFLMNHYSIIVQTGS